MNADRERDRAALPEPMRRDVRLLGDILGEVIRDSAGPELLADVERLRRAVIEARHGERDAGSAADPGPVRRSGAGDPAGDEIAALVGVLEPGPGRAGGARLHRLLSPGQPGRRAPAHPHPAGARFRAGSRCGSRSPPRSPRSATTRAASTWPSCSPRCACTWCSPRTPPRRAGARWWPRCAGSASCSTCWTTGAPGRPTTTRRGAGCASRSTCCGGHHSCGSRRWIRSTRSAR